MLRFIGMLIFAVVLPVGLEAQTARAWRLVEELRIGSVDGEAQALAFVGALAVDARGNVYVTQPRTDNNIRVFDGSGKLLRTIGRKGGGPGEFEGLGTIGFRGDTLFAADNQSHRTSLFAQDGRFISSFTLTRLTLPRPFGTGPASHLLPDGSVLITPGYFLEPNQGELRVPTFRLARDGTVLDTTLLVTRRTSTLTVSYPASSGQRNTLFTSQPFGDDPLTAIAPAGSHGFVVDRRAVQEARGAQFRVTKFRPNGDTVWSRTYNYSARRVADATLDSMASAFAKGVRGGLTTSEFAAAYRKAAFLPRYWPPVATAISSSDGGLWLRLNEASGNASRWLALNADGQTVATVSAAPGAQIRRVVGERVYATTSGELDVPYVVRYRIQK